MKFKKLVIGFFLLFLAFSMLFTAEEGFVLFPVFDIIAINTILNAFEINLVINTTSGQQRSIDFFIFEKSKAVQAENAINMLVAQRLNDTNMRQQTDRIVGALQNSMNFAG